MADSADMAGVLMLLSRGGRRRRRRRRGSGDQELETNNNKSSSGRVFECKTCNRQFPSFQALGGHRASHKKLRLMIPEGQLGQLGQQQQQKVHECSICGQEFAIGQALGGHMRRHRPPAEGSAGITNAGEGLGDQKRPRRRVWLDLNLPPSMSMDAADHDMECRKMGLEIVEPTVPMLLDYCLY